MLFDKLTAEDIVKLCIRLTEAEAAMLETYGLVNPPEDLQEAFELLWDCCLNYQSTFENFSHK